MHPSSFHPQLAWTRFVSGRMRDAVQCAMYMAALLAVAMIVVAAAPPDSLIEQAGPSAETLNGVASGRLSSRRRKVGRRQLYHVDVTETGEPCMQHPVWKRAIVDPDDYEFGCREIQVIHFIAAKQIHGLGTRVLNPPRGNPRSQRNARAMP